MLERHGNLRQLLCWWLVTALVFSLSTCSPTSRPLDDQSDLADSQITYDDYPVVVPKRAALLLDRLMVALEKAVESEAAEKGMTNRIPQDDTWKMDLQRRGQKNGRTYWRCYFNACHKRLKLYTEMKNTKNPCKVINKKGVSIVQKEKSKTARKTSQRHNHHDGLDFIIERFERLLLKNAREKDHHASKSKSRERLCLRAKAFAKVAAAAFQNREFSKALQLLTRAINFMPSAASFAKRSVVHLAMENYQLAASDGTWAIGVDRKSPSGYFCRALALIYLREYRLALRDLDRLRICLPNSKRCNQLYVMCRDQFWETGQIEPFDEPDDIMDVPVNEECSVFSNDKMNELKLELSSSGVLEASKFTEEFVIRVIETYKQGIFHLPVKHVIMVLQHVLELLKDQENIVNIDITQNQSLTVVGDIRGNFHNLMSIFHQNKSPQFGRPYIFNGNIIGDYKMSLPCIVTILCMKILFPDDVFINRGSEECLERCEKNGFENEVLTVYDDEVMKGFTEVFNWLPLAHVLNNSVLILHGGLFRKKNTLIAEIQRVKRWFQPPDIGPICDILHSDPWNYRGISTKGRRRGVWFGPDATYRFCQANCLDYIVRSHQMPNLMGYETQAHRYCVTVNSSSQHATYLKIPGGTYIYHVNHGRKEMKIPKNCSCWIMCNCSCRVEEEREEDSLKDYVTAKLDLLPAPSEPSYKSLSMPSSTRSLARSKSSNLNKTHSSTLREHKKNHAHDTSNPIVFTEEINKRLHKSSSTNLGKSAQSSVKMSEQSLLSEAERSPSPPAPSSSTQPSIPVVQKTSQPSTIGDEHASATTQSNTIINTNTDNREQTENVNVNIRKAGSSSQEDIPSSSLGLVRSKTRSSHWLAGDHNLSPIHSIWSLGHEYVGEYFATDE
ncbi:hypothetical protein GE061_015460 [Apolygus lucorum]|uniref:Serine/threonine specific protein phosphatases domain-containing protein n=1 Tax=Apolygus lucorum TaxID=248454 RepID=A0A8S9XN43_APOLU|nr:hypothetical protein GE061_015460 [Apolygus lucorum]